MTWFKNYKYKGLALIFISILLTIFLSKYNLLNEGFFNIRHTPFLGSFIAGILYVSASTAVIGILMLSDLSKTLSPIEIAIIAGLGGAIADFVLFRFFKGDLISEIKPIYNRLGGKHVTKLMYHKYFRWALPVIGALIIASPFPDELGIALMGISRIKTYQFIILAFILDSLGVFLFVSAFSIF